MVVSRSPRSNASPGLMGRVSMAALAIGSLAIGVLIALNHPLGLWVFGLFILAAALAIYSPWFLFSLPLAALPIVDFAPWSGWITFEEFDLIVLAMAGGAYFRLVFDTDFSLRKPGSRRRATENYSAQEETKLINQPDSAYAAMVSGKSAWIFILLSFYTISLLVSIERGLADAGGFSFGWFQGYDGSMNSLRVGKPFFLVALLIPAMLFLLKRNGSKLVSYIGWGFASGLGSASLAALIERLAYTGLLNFSTDYRTTALFWEMHVGGAALDGWLLLTFPFAIWAYKNSKGIFQRSFAMSVLAVAAYAAMTTFSRGVYVALFGSMFVLGFLLWKKQLDSYARGQMMSGLLGWGIALTGLFVLIYFSFTSAGYRGLIALLGLVFVMLSLSPILKVLSFKQFGLSTIAGLLAGSVLVIGSNFLDKGPYFLYTIIFTSMFYLLRGRIWHSLSTGAAVSWAGYVCLVLSAINIAGYWGGVEALPEFSLAALLLAVPLAASFFSKQALWPSELRSHIRLLMIAIAVSGVGVLFLGGAYMGGRFATSGNDLANRTSHWGMALSSLHSSSDFIWGKGIGRFPSSFHDDGPREKIAGSYGVNTERGEAYLSLVSAIHPMSEGDILRISQRLDGRDTGPFEVEFKGRASMPVKVHLEICDKHLLYDAACMFGAVIVKPSESGWNRYRIKLAGDALSDDLLSGLRFKVFSIGLVTHSARVDIDDIAIYHAGGASVLSNGGFSDNMARWFMTSDRDHMPWHTKSLPINLLVDQGIVGLALFFLLTVLALGKMLASHSVNVGIAPYAIAGVIGFLIVGLFDSLLDVPRLAFAYYLLSTFCLLFSFSAKGNQPSRGATQ